MHSVFLDTGDSICRHSVAAIHRTGPESTGSGDRAVHAGFVGTLLNSVCGAVSLLQLLPGGELCSMTVSAALSLAPNAAVAHISINNTLQGTSAGIPIYDYMPQTVQPRNRYRSANTHAGQNIGVARDRQRYTRNMSDAMEQIQGCWRICSSRQSVDA